MKARDKGEGVVTNTERLREHLDDGSLAAKLVDTYRENASEDRAVALRSVVEARLVEIRATLVETGSNAPD